MSRKNSEAVKSMRERTQKNLSSQYREESKKFAGQIRGQFVGRGDCLISTAEMKVCIDELSAKLQEKKDDRYAKILEEFTSIYEPVKTCKYIPVVKSADRVLNVVGEVKENDPEILKVINAKCSANHATNETVKKIVESRENFYGRR